MAKKSTATQRTGTNTLTIRGVTYTLAWDFNALARVQSELGINLLADEDDLSPERLRARLWAALLPLHPEMTVEEAGKLINLKTLKFILPAVSKTWAEPDEQEPNEGDVTE